MARCGPPAVRGDERGPRRHALLPGPARRPVERGFGVWAVEVPGVTPFAGFAGLAVPRPEVGLGAPVEVAWRLARACWGRGYATEAARAALDIGFGPLGLDEIIAMAVATNVRSLAVMARLGMRHDPGRDFLHPELPAGHPLRPHVVWRIGRGEWSAAGGGRPRGPDG